MIFASDEQDMRIRIRMIMQGAGILGMLLFLSADVVFREEDDV